MPSPMQAPHWPMYNHSSSFVNNLPIQVEVPRNVYSQTISSGSHMSQIRIFYLSIRQAASRTKGGSSGSPSGRSDEDKRARAIKVREEKTVMIYLVGEVTTWFKGFLDVATDQ
ncbi:PREDICTED: uncharacterized protein LOC109113945 [Nelumbo nucifera]|uniref:Uncharacterized protein LOC109113945 n=1 Tax=Nelumbo nucifera TaxID=4432 RepID=A0A1U8Q0B6_NELNU|nr:PREDICTED: uncharacterized protein LOC109113945 [Nelumbo nucifera]